MRRWGHRERVSTAVPADVRDAAGLEPGERVLAAARSEDGDWLLGGRRRLVLVLADGEVVALPWEQVEDARWDREESRLRVSAVGAFGTARPEWTFALDDPERLLQLLRERVTASVVLQRRVPVREGRGLTVIGRRNPAGGPVAWMHAYDEGLDPDDPEVVVVADLALAQARAEVGDTL